VADIAGILGGKGIDDSIDSVYEANRAFTHSLELIGGASMAREAKDRSSEWLIEHHADSLLAVAGVTGFTSCKAVNAVMVHPKRTPDGLLEVTFPAHPTPSLFLVEVTTYPDKEERDQVLEDIALVLLERRVVPEAISIVLSARGNQTLEGQHQKTSWHGHTSLECKWRVVRLWEQSAQRLLDLNQPGILPLVPLTQFSEDPADLLELCRERIDRLAPPEERDNLLAIAATMTAFRYNVDALFDIFARRLTVNENPFLARIERQGELKAAHKFILGALEDRFGAVPEELQLRVRRITEEERLNTLHRDAVLSDNLQAFTEKMDLATTASGS
jgi:hypothetical protein